jgi:hypothetical protein
MNDHLPTQEDLEAACVAYEAWSLRCPASALIPGSRVMFYHGYIEALKAAK